MVLPKESKNYGGSYGVMNDPVLSTLWTRLYAQDRNALVIVTGDTGARKSGSAISLATMLDSQNGRTRFYWQYPDGSIDTSRIVFSAKDFLQLIQGDLPTGSCIVWDEVGVEGDNTEFQSLKSKLIKWTMQTFRYKNLCVFFTVPDMPSVQIGIRRLLHAHLEMSGIPKNPNLPKEKFAEGSWNWIVSDKKTGKIYFKNPRYEVLKSDELQKYRRINPYIIPRPPIALEKAYKKKKAKATQKMYDHFGAEIEFMKSALGEKFGSGADGEAKLYSLSEAEAKVMEDPLKYFNPVKERFVDILLETDSNLNLKTTMVKKLTMLLNTKYQRGELILPEKSPVVESETLIK